MKITLVRHGEVDEAFLRKYNGHLDIGLSNRGKTEAKLLGEYFKDMDFDLVYCSDLKRAKDTLAAFKQAKDAIYTSKLREKSWGKHEGLGFDEIIAQNEISYENFEQWIESLDGESYKDYRNRVKKFFFDFLLKKSYENILIVTHAGVIRVLMALVKNLSLEDAFCIDLPYLSFVVFDSDKNDFSFIKSIV